MTRFAVCTALYEAARPFFPAYLAGLERAADGEELSLVVAVDDVRDPDDMLDRLSAVCPVAVVGAPESASPARVRRSLLSEALASPAEYLIFADMDDALAPDAPGLHRDALQDADISFGDMRLIDENGRDLGRRFFAGAGVPWNLQGVGGLLDRNFLGLTNTAVRRDSVPDAVLSVPDDIVAVDWWMFTTMLLSGRTAQRIPEPVCDYRIYGANTVGAGMPTSRDDLRRFIDVARRHYRAFPASAAHALRGARLENLSDNIAGWSAHELAVALAVTARRKGVWFEFLNQLMEPRGAVAGVSTAVQEVSR